MKNMKTNPRCVKDWIQDSIQKVFSIQKKKKTNTRYVKILDP